MGPLETPTELRGYERLNLSEPHKDVLRTRAIAPEVAEARGVFTALAAEQLENLGFAPVQRRTPALVIPISDPLGHRVTACIRPDEPRLNERGKKLKYEWPANQPLRLDVPKSMVPRLRDTSAPLFITEGSLKADALASFGQCSVGIPGVWGWGRQAPVIGDWDNIPLKNGRTPRLVYIAFDNDITRKREVYSALVGLRQFLLNRGAEVQIVYLPDGGDGEHEKIGVDDFLARGGTVDDLKSFARPELIEPSPEVRDASTLRLLTVPDVLSMPEYEYLVQGVLHTNSCALLVSPTGAGKTYLSLGIGFSVALGRPWIGREVAQGPTLYVAAEGVSGMRARIRAQLISHDIEESVAPISFVPQPVQLLDAGQTDDLLELIQQMDEAPKLVVIDTFARCMVGGDENSARDVGLVVEHADRVRRETGAVVLILHHVGKNGVGERGSSALKAAVDTMMTLSADGSYLTLTCDKQRDMEPFEPISLNLSPVQLPDGSMSCVVEPSESSDDDTRLRESDLKALNALLDVFDDDGATSARWEDVSGLSGRTFHRAKRRLIERNLVKKVGAGQGSRYVRVPVT